MRRSYGFTLVEVIIAVALSGLVVLGATGLLNQVGDARDALARQALRADREFNGERLLRQLVRNADVGTDTAQRFTGSATSASFLTSCAVPAGWLESCRVQLLADTVRDSTVLSARLPDGNVTLQRMLGTRRFAYLGGATGAHVWLAAWGTSISLPFAVGVVGDADTIWLPVGSGSR